MQYNGKFINPYEVLGLPHASDFELVKATYRSLVKIYHPDVFKGDKEFAKERLSQLNAAHEFLSDEQQKRDFDKSPQSQEKGEAEQSFDPDQNTNEFDEGIKILKENWDYACDYYPELKQFYVDLRTLGTEPAFAFMAYVVETKKYKEAATIADKLEDAFLKIKFTDDPKIKHLAKLALQQKEIAFAKELNRALNILGPDSKDDILEQLSQKFPEFAYEAYRSCNLMSMMSPKNPMAKKKADVADLRAKAKEKEQKDINDLIFFFGTLVILILVCFAAASAIYQ